MAETFGVRTCERCLSPRPVSDFGSASRKNPRRVCLPCVRETRRKKRQPRHVPSARLPMYKQRDALVLELGFTSYSAYLASPLWKKIRAVARQRGGMWCALCQERGTQIHHRHYGRRVLAGKKTSGLVLLCSRCHRAVEFFNDGFKRRAEDVDREFLRLLALERQRRRMERADPLDPPMWAR